MSVMRLLLIFGVTLCMWTIFGEFLQTPSRSKMRRRVRKVWPARLEEERDLVVRWYHQLKYVDLLGGSCRLTNGL